jgi:hypothetical protein
MFNQLYHKKTSRYLKEDLKEITCVIFNLTRILKKPYKILQRILLRLRQESYHIAS